MVLQWLSIIICKDEKKVVIRGSFSDSVDICSGVSQGCRFAALLFLIFINDVSLQLRSEFLLFADDLKLYGAVGSKSDMVILQQDLDILLR